MKVCDDEDGRNYVKFLYDYVEDFEHDRNSDREGRSRIVIYLLCRNVLFTLNIRSVGDKYGTWERPGDFSKDNHPLFLIV